jgi:excisionase family DNA binding protein
MAENSPLRISEAARAMGVSVSSVKRYIADGHLTPLVLPGGHRRIPAEQIEACFEQAGKQRKRARSRVQPRRPSTEAPKARKRQKRERRPKLGSVAPTPSYDTSEDALAAIRATYEGLTARPAA